MSEFKRTGEFRIGNYVYVPNRDIGGFPKKIGIISGISKSRIWIDDDNKNSYIILSVSAIHLTKETLFKVGFKDLDSFLLLDPLYYTGDNKFRILTNNFKGVQYGYNIEINYLHQLQNIYFDLAGKELDLKKQLIKHEMSLYVLF